MTRHPHIIWSHSMWKATGVTSSMLCPLCNTDMQTTWHKSPRGLTSWLLVSSMPTLPEGRDYTWEMTLYIKPLQGVWVQCKHKCIKSCMNKIHQQLSSWTINLGWVQMPFYSSKSATDVINGCSNMAVNVLFFYSTSKQLWPAADHKSPFWNTAVTPSISDWVQVSIPEATT